MEVHDHIDDELEVPEYFTCPISLQMMKDPVTTATGITYDRDSIEQWLLSNNNCPVTKQPLLLIMPAASPDLTPNHMLRRLIQSWCRDHASHGVDRIPTPRTHLLNTQVIKLLNRISSGPHMKSLRQLELLAAENTDRNRKYLVEAGVPKAMLSYIVKYCFENRSVMGLEEALSILHFIRIPFLVENDQVIQSLTWVLSCDLDHNNQLSTKSHALVILRALIESANCNSLEPAFFQTIVKVLRNGSITQEGINAALHVLLHTCPWRRNIIMLVQNGAVYELIELELASPEKKTTELILGVLFNLCCCADGRADLISHKGGIAVVAKRLLRVSPVADDRAVMILSLICQYSGSNIVMIREMLEVGAVSKLCLLLQAECAPYYLKVKAKEILKTHSHEWIKSPCILLDDHLVRYFQL